ncbi:MAG: hypothetical protein ACXWT1_15950 [Methylobacter sp.]
MNNIAVRALLFKNQGRLGLDIHEARAIVYRETEFVQQVAQAARKSALNREDRNIVAAVRYSFSNPCFRHFDRRQCQINQCVGGTKAFMRAITLR